jgi:uncharacterized protein YlaI/very-short-patch-repair endonuclease
MLLTTEVEMYWTSRIMNFYINKGYYYSKMGKIFLVNVNDLPPNSIKKVEVSCDICDKKLETDYQNYNNNIKINNGLYICQKCSSKIKRSNKTKWNLEKMQKYLNENISGFSVLDFKWVEKSYQKQIWALIKCSNKNHDSYWVWWNNVLSGRICKKCYEENNNITNWTKENIIKFYESHNLKIINVNDFKNNSTGLSCINEEGYFVNPSIANLQAGEKPHWLTYNKHALDNVSIYCQKYRPDYKIISSIYNGYNKKYKFKYIGNLLPENINPYFETRLSSFLYQHVEHSYFSSSKGEKIILDFLTNNNIFYLNEFKFKDCKHIYSMPFDFAIFEDEEKTKLKCLIEYDGQQHYKPVNFNGIDDTKAKELYKLVVKKDNIKNEYCNEQNIKLLRIPYWEFNNIKVILEQNLMLNTERCFS